MEVSKPKASIKDYEKYINVLKQEIEIKKASIKKLQNELENFKSIQNAKCCECCYEAVENYTDLRVKCNCFEDDYFKGFKYEEIAQLAKKSLKLTSENCIMSDKLENIKEYISNFDEKNIYLPDLVEMAKRIKEEIGE